MNCKETEVKILVSDNAHGANHTGLRERQPGSWLFKFAADDSEIRVISYYLLSLSSAPGTLFRPGASAES
jgi:hypothetical protein